MEFSKKAAGWAAACVRCVRGPAARRRADGLPMGARKENGYEPVHTMEIGAAVPPDSAPAGTPCWKVVGSALIVAAMCVGAGVAGNWLAHKEDTGGAPQAPAATTATGRYLDAICGGGVTPEEYEALFAPDCVVHDHDGLTRRHTGAGDVVPPSGWALHALVVDEDRACEL
jgi:hypothetical protein